MRMFNKFETCMQNTPEPLYNTVHYNATLDIKRTRVGSQLAIYDSFSYITSAIYSRYNTVWITNTEIDLDPENSAVKRLWCIDRIQWKF